MLVRTRRRSLNTRLVKRDFSYTVEEVTELLAVHANTVRNWFAAGLRSLDNRRPVLIHGSDLIAFLRKKQSDRRQTCAASELYCFKCRKPRKPRHNQIAIEQQNVRVARLVGICADCGTRMFKAASPRLHALYAEIFTLLPPQSEHIAVCANPAVNCDLEKEDSA